MGPADFLAQNPYQGGEQVPQLSLLWPLLRLGRCLGRRHHAALQEDDALCTTQGRDRCVWAGVPHVVPLFLSVSSGANRDLWQQILKLGS